MYNEIAIAETAKTIAESINKLANKYGFGNVISIENISKSKTNFGCSAYVNVCLDYAIFKAGVPNNRQKMRYSSEIRVSDHSVGGARITDYTHVTDQDLYNLAIARYDAAFARIAKLLEKEGVRNV